MRRLVFVVTELEVEDDDGLEEENKYATKVWNGVKW